VSKLNHFFVIAETLPFALSGYYSTGEKAWANLSATEKNGLRKILKAHIGKSHFEDDDLVEYCLTCLFRAIKIWVKDSSSIYNDTEQYQKDTVQSKEIKLLIEMLWENKFQKAHFYTLNGKKVTLQGVSSTFLLQSLFFYFESLERPAEEAVNRGSLTLSIIFQLKMLYQADLEKKANKRAYNKKVTYDEFYRNNVKAICKQLHKFLVKYSSLVPDGKLTTNEELRLISDFIRLTKLDNFENLESLRSFILR
jgi:hypothetical protein